MTTGKLDTKEQRHLLDLETPGTFADGKGLYLRVRAPGQGSWTVKFGKLEKSLGPADLIKPEQARLKHSAMRWEKHEGRDPWALLGARTILPGPASLASASPETGQEDTAALPKTPMRFADVVDSFLLHSPAVALWKANSTEARKYRKLKDGKLGKLWAHQVTSNNVADELMARWGHALASAEKNRMRLKLLFDYARPKGFTAKDAINPANNDDLKNLVAKPPKSIPHASMKVALVPAFISELAADKSIEARALAFAIHTVARTSEAIGADWKEIEPHGPEGHGYVWHIPASRIKEGASNGDHWVPLSKAALALLGKRKTSGLIFGDLPHDALDDKLKEYRSADVATVHGFRTSFTGWAVKAGYPATLWDRAMHHSPKKDGKSYNQEPLTEERRPMMAAWSSYITG
jgi:integrase